MRRDNTASSSRPLSALGEFGWLKELLPRLYWPSNLRSQLCIGPGDDAGALRIRSTRALVATTDALVEGLHFKRQWTSWRELGEKLLAVNLSDFAAMGRVTPLAVLVTAALPGDTSVSSVDNFYKGLKCCAQRWKTGFLGGDTVGSRQGWFVSATLLGEAYPHELVRRRGAKPGDLLACTGHLGLATAGLEVLQGGKNHWLWTKPLVKAFNRPQPQMAAGALLGRRQWATSLMDISDGLEASARLLMEASHCGVSLELAQAPIHSALQRWADYRKRDPREHIFKGGEDYQLLFTTRPSNWSLIKRHLPQAYLLGQVLPAREGCWARVGDSIVPLGNYGYDHFKTQR